MNIVYYCKHCKTFMGTIDGSKVSRAALGFTALTPEEQADIIDVSVADQTMYVKTVCEYCETALRQNPDLILTQTPLQ